jgi:hypothetical protein
MFLNLKFNYKITHISDLREIAITNSTLKKELIYAA